MLIGFTWALAYSLADEIQPGSFAGPTEPACSDYVARIMQTRYLSFMTLTTVGYGDVVPRTSVARTMAALEAVMGQLYLTVLVARLVGLPIVHEEDSPSLDKTARFQHLRKRNRLRFSAQAADRPHSDPGASRYH